MTRLLVLATLLAAPATAQPADSVAVRHTMTRSSGPISGAATGGTLVGPGGGAGRGASLGPPRNVLADHALPSEAGLYVADGSFGAVATAPLLRRLRSGSAAVGLSGTAILGVRRAAGGLFASAGTAGDYLIASAGAGAWAETSPRGRALGPAVEARVRLLVLRAEAGAVVAGARARWLRVGLDVPIVVVGGGGFAFVGVTVEARRFSDTGETLRTVGVSATF